MKNYVSKSVAPSKTKQKEVVIMILFLVKFEPSHGSNSVSGLTDFHDKKRSFTYDACIDTIHIHLGAKSLDRVLKKKSLHKQLESPNLSYACFSSC